MTNITISDLRPADSYLLSNSESFLDELKHSEIQSVKGGLPPLAVIAGTICLLNAAYDFCEGYGKGNKK